MSGKQIGGAIVGGAIGFAVGGFAGAAIGASIGFAAGTDLPSMSQDGPRLENLTSQTSSYGLGVKKVYGSARVAGNVIWMSDVAETSKTESSGGKGGGGSQATTYTYTASIAIAICEGEMEDVAKMWADTEVIFSDGVTDAYELVNENAAQTTSGTLIRLFKGTETQPICSDLAVLDLDAPAFRGVAYVFIKDLNLTNFGNRIPNFAFSISSVQGWSEILSSTRTMGQYPTWPRPAGLDVVEPLVPISAYAWSYDNFTHQYETEEEAIHASIDNGVASERFNIYNGYATTNDDIAGSTTTNSTGSILDNSVAIAVKHYSSWEYTKVIPLVVFDSATCLYLLNNGYLSPGNYSDIVYTSTASGVILYRIYNTSNPLPDGADSFISCTFEGSGVFIALQRAELIQAKRLVYEKVDDECVAFADPSSIPFYYDVGYRVCLGDPNLTAIQQAKLDVATDGLYKALKFPALEYLGGIEPIVSEDDAEYDDQAFWEAAYAASDAPDGWVYNVDYPEITEIVGGNFYSFGVWDKHQYDVYEKADISSSTVTVESLVRDILLSANIPSELFDLTSLEAKGDTVGGYVIDKSMEARKALEPLMAGFLFDAYDNGSKLVFKHRGEGFRQIDGVDVVVDELSIGLGKENKPVEITAKQDFELPVAVLLTHQDPEGDYQLNTQIASRDTVSTSAVMEVR